MNCPAVGLSVLTGEIKGVILRRGTVVARWETPEVWDEVNDFPAILKDIVAKNHPDNRQVALVLAHPRLTDQIVEVPPAKGSTLRRLLDRQAQTLKAFPGAAAWSRQPALPTKKGTASLVHLFPKSLLDQLGKSCQDAHLHLVRVLPTTSVLIAHLRALPLERDEVALLVAATGRGTTIVIGKKDGKVALSRVLPNSWSGTPERVWIDLTRSIGFAEQQSGVAVSSVWLFGPGAEAHVGTLTELLKLPVGLSPVPFTPSYWAEQASKLSTKDDGDLISVETREAPQRKRVLTLTSIILVVLLLLSIAAAAGIELFRQAEVRSVREIDRAMAKLQSQKTKWQQKYGEAALKKDFVRLVTEEKVLPLPALFLGYLGDIVPDDLVLADFRVQRTNDSWAVHLTGAARPSTNATAAAAAEQNFSSMRSNFVAGPFRVQVLNSYFGTAQPVAAAGPMAAIRAAALATTSRPGATNHFLIEGVIQ